MRHVQKKINSKKIHNNMKHLAFNLVDDSDHCRQ
jgi:hypothetical protein